MGKKNRNHNKTKKIKKRSQKSNRLVIRKKENRKIEINKNTIIIAGWIFLLLFSGILFFSARWYINRFGDTGFDSVLYTLFSKMNGTDPEAIQSYLFTALLPGIVISLGLSVLLWKKISLFSKLAREKKLQFYPFSKRLASGISVILSFVLIAISVITVDLPGYIVYARKDSSIYHEKYVDPLLAKITFPEEKRNMIFIFLESMENTYMSKNIGGAMEQNKIPELTELLEEKTNISFSHTNGIGGFYNVTGAGWTIGAMVSLTAGIPLKVPDGMDANSYGQNSFLPGVNTMMEVLQDAGYYQTLMVGSDAAFGGRKTYFEQHGMDKIYDVFTARKSGIIPPEYHVFWGMEDMYLFDYAKQELAEIAQRREPFAFSLLTVDTHGPEGYVCEKCNNLWDESYENAISCSSKQTTEFIRWVQQQDFYENTTIVVVGDHLTHGWDYISGNVAGEYQRTVYNCIINSAVKTEYTKNRRFVAMDMFPTTLAALGCEIKGERLGLGTNLFSGQPTLVEEIGWETFDAEMKKGSDYYTKNFFF